MYTARVVLDSISPAGVRLTTLEVVFPRFCLAEFNTHRVFSRNSASSRAIPVKKMIERVLQDPVLPLEWGLNQPGMQATETLGPDHVRAAECSWLFARDTAAKQAEFMEYMGVHKQIVNRLIEPFLWHTVLVTSTEWDNFFKQRLDKAAQPEMQETARHMKAALDSSTPTEVGYGKWHMPFIREEDAELDPFEQRQVSIARCARVSYLCHDGKRDPIKDLDLYHKLKEGNHLSPFEHVATPPDMPGTTANFRGWTQARWFVEQALTV